MSNSIPTTNGLPSAREEIVSMSIWLNVWKDQSVMPVSTFNLRYFDQIQIRIPATSKSPVFTLITRMSWTPVISKLPVSNEWWTQAIYLSLVSVSESERNISICIWDCQDPLMLPSNFLSRCSSQKWIWGIVVMGRFRIPHETPPSPDHIIFHTLCNVL